jgi:hypothetical protein
MYPFAPPEPYLWRNRLTTLSEHLGYAPQERLLIINADDFGFSPDVNRAVEELFAHDKITSTTIMVPSVHYQDALARYSRVGRMSCGVHLTLTSDLAGSPATPVLPPERIPSLLSDGRHFFSNGEHFFAHADPPEAEAEATAQIEKALADGIDATHLDSHEGTLQLVPRFAEIFVRLAAKYRLPTRMGSRLLLEQLGLKTDWIDGVRRMGIHAPDNLIYIAIDQFNDYASKEAFVLQLIDDLPIGVTELYFHPSYPTTTETGANLDGVDFRNVRQWDFDILTSARFFERLQKNRIRMIGFRELRELTRSA